MREEASTVQVGNAAEERTGGQVLRTLIQKEWYAHGGSVRWFLSIAIVAISILPFMNHPGWVLGYAALVALFLGQALGGNEVLEGSEEFAFALPVSRREYYTAKCLFGLTVILALVALGTMSLRGNLAPALWGLLVESGFAGWRTLQAPAVVWQLCFLVPVALFSMILAMAALSKSRRLVAFAWLLGAAVVGGVVALGFHLETLFRLSQPDGRQHPLTGLYVIPALALVTFLALVGGMGLYSRKTVGSSSETDTRKTNTPVLLVIAVVVVLAVVFLLLSSRSVVRG